MLLFLLGCQAAVSRDADQQANTYIEKAQAFESQNHWVEALEQYKLAQTIDPHLAPVNDAIVRIEARLTRLADAHYRAGLQFRDKGKWDLAKKEFMKALYYRPEHTDAAAMLQGRSATGDGAYIMHTIAPGESISKLAIKYYGDYRKYPHIANFNNMADATQVRVGQKIMIPVIEGVSLEDLRRISQHVKVPRLEDRPAPRERSQVPVAKPAEHEPPAPTAPPATPPSTMPPPATPDDPMVEYRKAGIALFNANKFKGAITELEKVHDADPQDTTTTSYLSRAYTEVGRQHLSAGRFKDAKGALTTALDYDATCQQCRELLEQCRRGESEGLIAAGQTHLQQKKFDNAITTLKQAAAVDPENGKIRQVMSQAYYQKALTLYDRKDYLAAKNNFENALAVNPDCQACQENIQKSVETYKAYHYNQGIVYFGKQELKQAIAEWQKVVAVDPGYKDVSQNLKKARQLDERLEMIKRGSD
ncbi:LysM peptidoglycan-binding domain-containing protein [Desulfosarcina cetonica]|uniref:LysM peptidoglycan-binding domain-containing protein n=1 Tax=Desulfosarcina cetonica TaxID=90730 RepID=UPI0006D15A8C|nr:LysM domain-containing protein [Desulfosarcina cetonica]